MNQILSITLMRNVLVGLCIILSFGAMTLSANAQDTRDWENPPNEGFIVIGQVGPGNTILNSKFADKAGEILTTSNLSGRTLVRVSEYENEVVNIYQYSPQGLLLKNLLGAWDGQFSVTVTSVTVWKTDGWVLAEVRKNN